PAAEPKARQRGASALGVEYKVKYWIDCAQIGPGKPRHVAVTSLLDHLHAAGVTHAVPKQEMRYALTGDGEDVSRGTLFPAIHMAAIDAPRERRPRRSSPISRRRQRRTNSALSTLAPALT